jgi:hypothetical protein
VSEYPQPWHRLDPAEWPATERRIRNVISAVESGRLPLPKNLVGTLRFMLPAPRPTPKLRPLLPPYRLA